MVKKSNEVKILTSQKWKKKVKKKTWVNLVEHAKYASQVMKTR
jgi:hypothetical protein